jgi:hypothetical protein
MAVASGGEKRYENQGRDGGATRFAVRSGVQSEIPLRVKGRLKMARERRLPGWMLAVKVRTEVPMPLEISQAA